MLDNKPLQKCSDSSLFFWQGDPDDNKKIEFKAQG